MKGSFEKSRVAADNNYRGRFFVFDPQGNNRM